MFNFSYYHRASIHIYTAPQACDMLKLQVAENDFFSIRRLFFGVNEIAVRVPSLFKLLMKEVSSEL